MSERFNETQVDICYSLKQSAKYNTDAQEEFVSEFIAGLFSTDDGINDFITWFKDESGYTDEERKNTRPDIDRTDVVFAEQNIIDSYSVENKSESKQLIQLLNSNVLKVSPDNKYDVKGSGIVEGVKSEYVSKIFEAQGGFAVNDKLGKVSLNKKGAASTIFHGFGNTKLVSAYAIKDVIEHGYIISITKNYQSRNVDRYVLAAKGLINGENSYTVVAIESYPTQNDKKQFYLHESIIIKTASHIMTATQSSADTVSETVSDLTVPQTDTGSQDNDMQKSEKDTKKNSLKNKKVDRASITSYNEFNTLAMRWANSADTKVGDFKVICRGFDVFRLIESTEDGYIELVQSKYEEMRAECERIYRKENESVDRYVETYKSFKGRDNWNLLNADKAGNGGRDSKHYRDARNRFTTTGNDESVRPSDKEVSGDIESKYSLQHTSPDLVKQNQRLIRENEGYKEIVETLREQFKLKHGHNVVDV